jgi:hypothetical protein
MRQSRCFLILPLVLILGSVHAQEDSVAVDTVRNRFFPTGVRVGTDLISLVKTRTQTNFRGWEIQGDIDFHRYYLAFEYGTLGRNMGTDSATYANSGKFWRAGIDVNFLTKDPDRNMFFLGARYGRSVFTESLSVVREDPIWGVLSDNFHHSGVNAWWIELTAGLRVKIWKIFWLGYTGRLKFALSTDGTEEMLPHDVPGFGRNDKETAWGFNYYLMVRIPLRKAPPLPPGKD